MQAKGVVWLAHDDHKMSPEPSFQSLGPGCLSASPHATTPYRSVTMLFFLAHCREAMEYDVAVVGAGPAGLAAAIRLKQLSKERGLDLSVCVLEKGEEVGSHILSGAVTARHGHVLEFLAG